MARSASVTGEPGTSSNGIAIVSSMWPTMCTLNRYSWYAFTAPEVTHSSSSMPRTHMIVRYSGQWSPRRRRRHTPAR